MKEQSTHPGLASADPTKLRENSKEPTDEQVLSYQVKRNPWDTPFSETIQGSVLIYVTPEKRFGDMALVGGRILTSFTIVKHIISKAFSSYYPTPALGREHTHALYRSLSQPNDDDLIQVRTLGGFTIFSVNQANFNELMSIDKDDPVVLGELLRERPELCEDLFFRPYYAQMITQMHLKGYQLEGSVAQRALEDGFDLLGLMDSSSDREQSFVTYH